MRFYSIAHQVLFVYFGFAMQILAVLNSQSMAQTIQIFFISFAYLNAVVKTFVVHAKRKQLQDIWSKLDDKDYKATDKSEFQ